MSKSNEQTHTSPILQFLIFVSEIFKANVYEIINPIVQLSKFLIKE